MEVFVEFKTSCESSRSAQAILNLIQSIAEVTPEQRLDLSADEFELDSEEITSLERLIESHISHFACLETSEIDGKVVYSNFICGSDAEDFLIFLAKFAEKLKSSLIKLTAKFDEVIFVCDLIDGTPHLELFDDYETFEKNGFGEVKNKSQASNSGSLPEEYLGEWVLEEDESESDELTITETTFDSIRKVYGNTIRDSLTYSVSEFNAETISVTEYLEEMGDIEEFEIEMSLLDGGKYLQIQHQRPKRVFKYRKI